MQILADRLRLTQDALRATENRVIMLESEVSQLTNQITALGHRPVTQLSGPQQEMAQVFVPNEPMNHPPQPIRPVQPTFELRHNQNLPGHIPNGPSIPIQSRGGFGRGRGGGPGRWRGGPGNGRGGQAF